MAAHEDLHDARVDDGASCGDLVQGAQEFVDLADALLEEVGEAVGAAPEQLEGVVLVGVLESTTTPMPGWASRMAWAAVMPSVWWLGGIRMSATTTSGRRRATASRSSAAVPTAARTSASPVSSRRRRVPSRTR
ncbi:hypothetical protein SMD44_08777 [Streptomyces alboflavus]|uniref:Uncharacterized protein n=1 Tax=Streptomyces alboflavus TaxID=67267 RepID=A0A1Z1WS80_9ACTN|nr:hypothetical protein SMD44_08777 [Streptomyces alboflavus]